MFICEHIVAMTPTKHTNKPRVMLTHWMDKTMENSNVNLVKVRCIKRLRMLLSAAAKVSVSLPPLVHSQRHMDGRGFTCYFPIVSYKTL